MSATPTTTKQHPRLAVQAFWLTASKGIAAVLNIGLPILLVRLMAQTEYGVFKEAFLFVSTATNIATFGVGMSAFYFMPRHPERGGQIALNILVYNFVAGWIPLAVILAYPQILQKLFRTNAARTARRPAGISGAGYAHLQPGAANPHRHAGREVFHAFHRGQPGGARPYDRRSRGDVPLGQEHRDRGDGGPTSVDHPARSGISTNASRASGGTSIGTSSRSSWPTPYRTAPSACCG